MLYLNLERLFESLDLSFCDSQASNILISNEFSTFRQIIPKWDNLIQQGFKIDKEETQRTIKHIFRSLYIYFSIQNDQFEINIGSKFKNFLKLNLTSVYDIHPDLFIYILLYHDIGRPFNRVWHTFESVKIMNDSDINLKKKIPQKYINILFGVIKYHLLLGTIFTGESSYLGAIILLRDKRLQDVWESSEKTELFFQILLLFTVIDILGYEYSKIFNHYLHYYLMIKDNLVNSFNHIRTIKNPDEKERTLFNILHKLDKENLKWRIACCLRIFQFVSTKPNLTEDFYFRKIDEGLEKIGSNWQLFKRKLSKVHPLIQYKYALPLMMILASGSFFRSPIDKDFIVDSNIYRFWEVCTSKVKKNTLYYDRTNLWNIIFQFPRNWFQNLNFLNIFRAEKLFFLIDITKPTLEPSFSTYQLYINYPV